MQETTQGSSIKMCVVHPKKSDNQHTVSKGKGSLCNNHCMILKTVYTDVHKPAADNTKEVIKKGISMPALVLLVSY